MSDILQEIVAHKRTEVDRAKRLRPTASLEASLAAAPAVRGFVAALEAREPIALIAEVKQASPSAGLIRSEFDPVKIATAYERHGATCISVLTDEKYFRGSLDDLIAVRKTIRLPVLRKDFLVDRYQVLEARAAGADCVLLIAECLDDCRLRDLYFYASELGMDALIELYEVENLDRVLKLEPPLIGVNNRNLRTFVTELDHTVQLAPRIVPQALLVSESGIRTRDDVLKLRAAGVRAILVGETLMRSDDVGAEISELLA
jgi:indole-3-glycerol phosphate synthase